MTEHWVPTPYPGYEVSSLGRVRSIDRIDSIGRLRRGRVLRPCGSGRSRRYQVVVVSVGGRTKKIKVHQLVLSVFVESRPNDRPYACHRDDNQLNNSLENLYWGTLEDCIRDKKINNKSNHNIHKKTCPAGHKYDYIDPGGRRGCRSCRRESNRKYRAGARARRENGQAAG